MCKNPQNIPQLLLLPCTIQNLYGRVTLKQSYQMKLYEKPKCFAFFSFEATHFAIKDSGVLNPYDFYLTYTIPQKVSEISVLEPLQIKAFIVEQSTQQKGEWEASLVIPTHNILQLHFPGELACTVRKGAVSSV